MATFSLIPVNSQPQANAVPTQAATFSLVPVNTPDISAMGAGELKQMVASGQITPEQAAQQVKNVAGNPNVLNAPAPKQGGMDALAGAGANLAGGYTFGLGDEASAALAAPIVALGGGMGIGEAYNKSLDEARKLQGQFSEQNPVTAGALNIAGAVANPLNRNLLSGAALKNSLTLGGIAQNAVTGAASGALYGAGNAEGGLQERIQGASEGAQTGALFGAAIPAGLNVAGKATTGVVSPAAKMAKNLVVGRNADQVFGEIVSRSKLTPEQLKSGLAAGNISTIADIAGDEVQGLTRSVGKMQGAKDIIADALKNRSAGSVSRVVDVLTKNISSVDTYFGNLQDVAKARATIARPLYEKAYASNPVIASKDIDAILDSPMGKDALQRASKSMQNRMAEMGVKDPVLSKQAKKMGLTDNGVARGLNLQSLDEVKKGFDAIYRANRISDPSIAAQATSLKNKLVQVLDSADKTGMYAKARKTFGGFSQLEDAQEAGLLFKRSTPEQIRMQLKEMTPDQREAYRIGVRESLQREVTQTATGADPAKRIFGNQFEREQLEAVLGKGKQFNDFAKRMQEEIRAADTKFKVLGGSRTDINMGGDSELGSIVTQLGTQGIKSTIFSRGVEYVGEKIQQRYYGISKANAEALARALTDKKGGMEALDRLIAKQSGKQKDIVSQAVQGMRTYSSQLKDPNTPVGGVVNKASKLLKDQRGALTIGEGLPTDTASRMARAREMGLEKPVNFKQARASLDYIKQLDASLYKAREGYAKLSEAQYDKFHQDLNNAVDEVAKNLGVSRDEAEAATDLFLSDKKAFFDKYEPKTTQAKKDSANLLASRPEATIAGMGLAGAGLASMFNNGNNLDRNVQNMGGDSIAPQGTFPQYQPLPSPMPVSKSVIIDEEGFEPRVYNDTVGKKTVGYGFNMSQPNARSIWARAGIPESFEGVMKGATEVSEASAQRLLDYVHRRADSAVDKIAPFAKSLGENQRAALTSMVYQMGAKGVQDFKKTLTYLKEGNSKAVENQLLTSRFARQTPARAQRTALMLAYNMSPQEAEQALVAAGRIKPDERKYVETPAEVAPAKRMRYADAKARLGVEDV